MKGLKKEIAHDVGPNEAGLEQEPRKDSNESKGTQVTMSRAHYMA